MKKLVDLLSFGNRMIGALQIPEDFIKGNLLISMVGQDHLTIENFKGISFYSEEEIRLLTRKNRICISGRNLKIDSYTKEEISISGNIQRLEYL